MPLVCKSTSGFFFIFCRKKKKFPLYLDPSVFTLELIKSIIYKGIVKKGESLDEKNSFCGKYEER